MSNAVVRAGLNSIFRTAQLVIKQASVTGAASNTMLQSIVQTRVDQQKRQQKAQQLVGAKADQSRLRLPRIGSMKQRSEQEGEPRRRPADPWTPGDDDDAD